MTERQHLMKKLMAERFATIETAIFLDTHPQDKKALKAFKEYSENTRKLKDEYENKFGALTAENAATDNSWTWICDPWPWD